MQLQVECHSSVLSMLQAGQPAGFADLLLLRVLQLVADKRPDLQLDVAGAAWQVRPPQAVSSGEATKWCRYMSALTTLLMCLCWDVQASGDANASLIPAKHPETTTEISSQAKKRPLIQELS